MVVYNGKIAIKHLLRRKEINTYSYAGTPFMYPDPWKPHAFSSIHFSATFSALTLFV